MAAKFVKPGLFLLSLVVLVVFTGAYSSAPVSGEGVAKDVGKPPATAGKTVGVGYGKPATKAGETVSVGVGAGDHGRFRRCFETPISTPDLKDFCCGKDESCWPTLASCNEACG